MRHSAALLEYDDIGHGFFGRSGGVSTGIFSTLNCGLRSGDVMDAVTENRARAIYKIAANDVPLVTLAQVHSPEVLTISAPLDMKEPLQADGMVTRNRNI